MPMHFRHFMTRRAGLLLAFLLLVGCASQIAPTGTTTSVPSTTPVAAAQPGVYGPAELRRAYHVDSLIQQGFTGKGQTIIDLVCFGNPQVQSDLDTYSQAYGLPHVTVQQVAPLGPNPTPANDADRQFQNRWAGETSLDVELYHALAPDAAIAVVATNVCAPEGLVGMSQSRETLQYALDHHLGNIISVSGGTSEATLADPASRAELKLWDPILQQSTMQGGVTYFVSSGDNGATDFQDRNATQLATSPTTSFPTDSPWVTSVGGSTLQPTATGFAEQAWNNSGGGFSAFYDEPAYQHALPAAAQTLLQGRRGVPDVAADANPRTGVRVSIQGQWQSFGGTSISAPIWAGIMAVADQMAGKSLGFINPALYQIGLSSKAATDFNDITQGNNTQLLGNTTVHGYPAVAGWDPITGFGTPNAAKLIPDLIALLAGKSLG